MTVVGLTDAVDVDGGAGLSCGVRATGEVACWGTNTDGQLGNGETRTVEPTPVATLGIDDAVAVSLGANNACALRASGRVSCWGFDGSGRIGDGPGPTEAPVPVDVVGLEDAVQIAASDNGHVCAVRRTDDIVCWGNGARGALGTGEDGGHSDVPVAVLPHG